MVNKLYSILTLGMEVSGPWAKLRCPIRITKRGESLRKSVIGTVDKSHFPLIACILCWYSRYGCLGTAIIELDPENTYSKPISYDSDHLNESEVYFNGISGISANWPDIKRGLDIDIQDSLNICTWQDMISGICLQLLREAL